MTLGLALYPLLVYWGLTYLSPVWIAGLLLVLCVARLLAAAGSRSVSPGGSVAIVCGGGIVLALVSAARQSAQAVMFYPALVNAALLVVFAYSIANPPTVIERIARMSEKSELSPAAIAYTRSVTVSWCVFFTLNGAAALYTASFSSMQTWTLYNGVVAYVLIGIMLVGERIVRRFAMARPRA